MADTKLSTTTDSNEIVVAGIRFENYQHVIFFSFLSYFAPKYNKIFKRFQAEL